MRILQCNKAYYPHVGGIETVVHQAAEGLARRGGFESSVLACGSGRRSRRETLNGVEVTYAGTLARMLSMPISPDYVRRLRGERADVLQTHEPFPLSGLSYVSLGEKAKSHFGRTCMWWHSDIIRQRALRTFYAPITRRALAAADAVIVATPNHIDTSEFLPDYRAKCHVIPYGIEPAAYEMTPEVAAKVARLREAHGYGLVLFVGRLVYYKGVEHLIHAMGLLSSARLLIVGDGPLGASLRRLAATVAPGKVTFLPPQSQPDLVSLYHACDVFALPSVARAEQFGIVQLEAMVCGKPVVTSDLPTGVTHVNQDGTTGIVVPVADPPALAAAIARLLGDGDLARACGAAGRERVLGRFTVDRMVDSLAELYRGL